MAKSKTVTVRGREYWRAASEFPEEDLRATRKRNIANRQMIDDLQALETRAHAAGLHVTAHAINNAKNAAGWEMAGNVKVAGLAAKGQRVGDGGKR